MPGCVTGGVCPGVSHGVYAQVSHGVYAQVYLPVYAQVYLPVYATLPTLGTLCTPAHPAHACRYPVAGAVCGEEALGSTVRIIKEREASVRLRASRVLQVLCPSAQSYSGSPRITVRKIG